MWGGDHQLQGRLKCIVSIGTGVPAVKPLRDDAFGIWATLKKLATETELTAEQFRQDKASLENDGRYYRFNVVHGLDDVGLEESQKKAEIAAVTRRYITSQAVFEQMKACGNVLAGRECESIYTSFLEATDLTPSLGGLADVVFSLDRGPYRTAFALQGVPQSNNFVDRPSDTDELEKCLLQSPQQRHRRKIFVVHGLGGIGKTQLAASFARRHQHAFSSVLWLDGRSEDQLRKSLASYARKIPDGQIPASRKTCALSDEAELNAVVADVLDWLARPDNLDWLMVFDNVDHDQQQGGATSAYEITKYLPGDHGSVLVTTRLSQLAQLGESKPLQKVDEDLSKAIFSQWYGKDLVMDESGKELLRRLDGLPLALAQAAAYVRETGCGLATYVRLYEQQWDDLMGSAEPDSRPLLDYHQGSVATTWSISLNAIEAMNTNTSINATNLLRLWAFLDNRDFWHGLLEMAEADRRRRRETWAEWDSGTNWPSWLCEMACHEVKFLEAARLLRRYSMIESHASVPGSYSMHPVVHRWSSYVSRGQEKETFLRLAVMLVGWSDSEYSESFSWELKQRIFVHAEMCMQWVETINWHWWECGDTGVLHAMAWLGMLNLRQTRLSDGVTMLQRALKGYERTLAPSHPLAIHLATSLGAAYRLHGRLDEAETMCQRALHDCGKISSLEHERTFNARRNLGLVYMGQGRLEEAKNMLLQLLGSQERVFGPNHAETADTLVSLADVYKSQGCLDKSEAMLQQALQRIEKGKGVTWTPTLSFLTYDYLGAIYARQGRLEKAEQMYGQALSGYKSTVGPSHPWSQDMMKEIELLRQTKGNAKTESSSALSPIPPGTKGASNKTESGHQAGNGGVFGQLSWNGERRLRRIFKWPKGE